MCLICDRIEMIKRGENPYFVRELKTGYVVIGDHQHFRGYTLFLYKEHGDKTELFHLDKAERALFLEEMTIVAQAAAKAFGAEKITPRVSGDLGSYGNHGKGPVWWYPMEKMYSDETRPNADELQNMKRLLSAALDEILAEGTQ